MRSESLAADNWEAVVERLGGGDLLEREARATGAFRRRREVASAVDLLRLTLAYCLGSLGFRATAAWAETIDLASLSNVALLKRVRATSGWLAVMLARLIAAEAPGREAGDVRDLARGRLIRLVDATVVAKAARAERQAGGVWRVHSVFNLDGTTEHFSAFDLTDEKEGERLDRAGVVAGEIRIADRAYLQPDRMARVLAAGADVIIRAPWNGARWLDADGAPFNLIGTLMRAKAKGIVDCPVWIGTGDGAPLALRLVAIRKPEAAIEETRRKLEAEASSKGRELQVDTLIAAGWVILVTSLDGCEFPAAAIGGLYRLRWRIEIAFKHLKSGLGLARPPGTDPEIAKAHVLSHLLMAVLAEPLVADHLGASPRRAKAQPERPATRRLRRKAAA